MTAIELIAAACRGGCEDAPEVPFGAFPGVCCVTGIECDTLPKKDVLASTFTNGDLLRAPSSGSIGVDAYLALRFKWERMSSWMVSEAGFSRLDRQGVRRLVIETPPCARTWAAYATTSYKKHGSLFAPVNTGMRARWQWESLLVDCGDRITVADYWARLTGMQRRGMPRPVLENLTPTTKQIVVVGLREWSAFAKWAERRFRTPLYQFICYLLPSQEEMKNAGHDQRKDAGVSAAGEASRIPQEARQSDLFVVEP